MILEIQKGKDNPILRKKSQPIKKIDENILKLARDIIETINKNNGIGLSACQVGKNIQMFVIIKELSKKQIFINPEIIKTSKKSSIVEEGCLSVPGIYLPIKRAMSLKIKAFDENNKQFKLKATDLLAQAIQHEMDHLNGILITDHEKN
ncbi:MAG TPA: peptide deformylase [bacterium]|nr:peptide deformylase [bacterium]